MSTYYVYILQCKDGSYYTGITNNLQKRVAQHQSGEHSQAYTYRRRPVYLVWHTSFLDPQAAIHLEKKLKGWSRKKKAALIRGDYTSLPSLAKKNFEGK